MKKLLLVSLCFLMLFATQVFAQNRTVTGTVTAKDDGLPIPGVTVKVKGANIGTQTNTAGKFSLSVPSGAVLEFSFIGYSTLDVAASPVMTVSLATVSNQLGEIVVTGALGLKTQSKELGYATAVISNKELTQAKVTNAATGLAGKVSGLQVNLTDNSVDPSVRIVLRGNRSLTGNNEALLVVDGVPIDDDNYINTINPEDVESSNILKGAVAAAIYGSKASNGVLIITTKHGTKGTPTITLSNTTYLEKLSFLPKLQTEFGGYGGEGGAYVNDDGTVNPVGYENEGFGPIFDGRKLLLALSPVFKSDGVTVDHYDSLYTTYSAKKNNIKNFFNTGVQNQFNASYSTGSENGTFYLGFQQINHAGIVPGDKALRDNFDIAGSHSYGKFNADYKVSYNQNSVNEVGNSYNQTNGGVFSGRPLYFEVINTLPNIPLEDFKDPNGKFGNPNSYFGAYSTNPYWTLQNSRQKRTDYDLLGTVNLSYKINSWITVADRIGITQKTEQFNYTRAGITFAPWAILDPQSAGNIPKSQKYLAPSDYDATFFEQRLNNDLYATIKKNFGDFSVNALLGFNAAQRYQRTIALEGDALQFPGDYNIGSVLGVPGYAESTFKQREYSFYEDVTLGYKEFLYLHLTNRDEWNSVLNPAKDHYEYPGANLSFVFTNAIPSLKDNKILSYGKIFGGATEVANINIGGNPYGAYSLINPFVPPAGYPYNAIGGYTQSSTYLNPDIAPEKTTEYEIGTELGFLDNRINLKADFYNSKTKNQSLTAVISAATGFSSKLTNAGLITNTGEEFDLNVIPVKTDKITWNVGLTYSHYKNVVNELLPGVDELQLSSFGDGVGGGIYAIKGKPFPVIKTNDFVRDPKTGKVIVDAKTGLPSVDPTESIFGNTNPTQILGITSSLSYKDFTFSFVLDYRGGNSIMNSIADYLDFTGLGAQSAENGHQRFIYPNSVVNTGTSAAPVYSPNTNVAVNNGGNTANHGFFPDIIYSSTPPGSLFITSAAYWKLREANITYNIPKSALAQLGFIKRASVSLIGRNLLTLKPKSNLYTDPEFSQAGTGNAIGETTDNQTPPTRFFGANLTVVF